MHLEAIASLKKIPDGPEGVYSTLRLMRKLTREGKKDFIIRRLANRLTQDLEQKNWRAEVNALFYFVRDKIRYLKDIRGVETLSAPHITLELGQGDCDDKSVLLASLLESIGHPTRFVAIGFRPKHFSHVFPQTKIGENWITLETTEPVRPGWHPKGVVSHMIVYN